MADTALRTPFTFFLHVADFPNNVGIGGTPEAARDALKADLFRDLGAGPDTARLVEETLATAHAITVTAADARGVRCIVEGLLGRVGAVRVLATLLGVS